MIYLDQMVVSEIAKKLDPVWREEKPHTDDFWLEVFDRIDRLVKLQLIVCPSSPIHTVESLLLEQYEPTLRRLHGHLAAGVSFRSPHEVRMMQLSEAFDAWTEGRDPDWSCIASEHVIRGDLDRWSDRLRIAVDLNRLPGEIEGHRASRARGHDDIKRLFKRWSSEDQPSFDGFFQQELRGFANGAFECFWNHSERLHRALAGAEPIADPLRIIPGEPARLVGWVLRRLADQGVPPEARLREAASFLYSEAALSAPENHLGALLFAAFAWQAACGRRRVPNEGTSSDIRFIAAYLPYCDAMFIDREFAHLLSQEPLATAVKDYRAKIFAYRSRADFLEYLVGLEEEADAAHVALVTETYGETWTEPYRSILEHQRPKRAASK